RLAAVAEQVGIAGGADASDGRLSRRVGGLHRGHAPRFHLLQIIRIDAGLQWVGPPEAERIRAFVVVRGRDEYVMEAGEFLANAFDTAVKQTDHIDGSQGDAAIAIGQNAGPKRWRS